jgi:hypothetical protein
MNKEVIVKSYIIVNNKHDAKSRGFCNLFGEGHNILDWYGDLAARDVYISSGYPSPGIFPFVVDPDTKEGVVADNSLSETIAKFTIVIPE